MAASDTSRKRILTKDLASRLDELERKLAEIADQLAKLDERVTKIANSVAQAHLGAGLSRP